MKKISALLLVAGILLFQACGNDTSMDNDNDTTMLTDTMASVPMEPLSESDSEFVMDAAQGGMMEVQLGQYAQQNASNQRVKDFGSMMVRDHSQANDKLRSLVSGRSNISIPSSVGEDKMDKMNDLMKKTGKNFDKAYMNMMVDDHKTDIDEFQKAANNAEAGDIKSFASTTLPTLQMHLDSAQAIVKDNNY